MVDRFFLDVQSLLIATYSFGLAMSKQKEKKKSGLVVSKNSIKAGAQPFAWVVTQPTAHWF